MHFPSLYVLLELVLEIEILSTKIFIIGFLKISRALERILMECIVSICSLKYMLFSVFICSIRILSRNRGIDKSIDPGILVVLFPHCLLSFKLAKCLASFGE